MQVFYAPTRVVTGSGCLDRLGEYVCGLGSRALLVTGTSSAQHSGVAQRALDVLARQGIAATTYAGVTGEASLDMVRDGIAVARDAGTRVIIGLGGGSAIDTAKAIAGLVDQPGPLDGYHDGRALGVSSRPFVAIPTTAGTGAEVTKNAVLINPATGEKKSIRDDGWFARVALVDPELTLSAPPEVTASTGADALAQGIEAFTSIAAGPLSDALAARAIALIVGNLERAYSDGNDLEAREAMSMGSLMAGMAMASARLGGIHGMAHPLGSHYRIPHGIVCGLLLPYVMAYNLRHAELKYALIAEMFDPASRHLTQPEAAERAVEWVGDLMRAIGIPDRLGAYGVREEDYDQIIAESLPSGSLQHNPRRLEADDVRRILEQAQ